MCYGRKYRDIAAAKPNFIDYVRGGLGKPIVIVAAIERITIGVPVAEGLRRSPTNIAVGLGSGEAAKPVALSVEIAALGRHIVAYKRARNRARQL